MSELGRKIANAALGWLGTPHVNQARVKHKGVDCGMLLIASLEDAGAIPKNAIKVEPYSNEWHLHRSTEWFKSVVEQHCERVSDLQEGDFVMYQYGRCISHGAVYIGDGVVCHSLIGQGCILSNMDEVIFLDAFGQSRVRGYYRFKGAIE